MKSEKATMSFVVKFSREQRAQLQKKANAYTDGNLSEWLRLAATEYVPKRSQLHEVRPKNQRLA